MEPEFCARVKATLQEGLSFFEPVDVPGGIPSDSCLFCWRLHTGLTAYLLFYPINRRGRFKVDAAWSTHGNYPAHLSQMVVRRDEKLNIPADNPINGEFRFPVSELWDPSRDRSWRAETSARGNDLKSVVREIGSHFVPYMRQLDPNCPGGWSSVREL